LLLQSVDGLTPLQAGKQGEERKVGKSGKVYRGSPGRATRLPGFTKKNRSQQTILPVMTIV
jgi:hypothetical protein